MTENTKTYTLGDQKLEIHKEDPKTQSFHFVVGGIEFIKLCGDGKIFVKGKETTEDMELVNAMREFLAGVKVESK